MIKLKRARETAKPEDGFRILVERLWPRGVRKAALPLDQWQKEVAPSTELRKWFSHDPEKWNEFRKRYFQELNSNPEAWRPLATAARRGAITLVFSSHDIEHNNAVALKSYLESKLRTRRARHLE